jgi:hypothetical protein
MRRRTATERLFDMLKQAIGDRSVRFKIMTIAMTLALVAGVIPVMAVSRLSAVHETAQAIVTENVELQRSSGCCWDSRVPSTWPVGSSPRCGPSPTRSDRSPRAT